MRERDGFRVFMVPDGGKVEVFDADDPQNQRVTTGPVAGLLVDDVRLDPLPEETLST